MIIVTLEIQNTIKPIACDDEAKFLQLSSEVQYYEIRRMLGVPFYNDMLANVATDKYVKLINGDDWQVSGNMYSHAGLKKVIAYINYSKWVYLSELIESYTGVVMQRNDYANKANEGYIKRLSDEAFQIAMDEWQLIKQYLSYKNDVYPLFYCNSNTTKKPIITNIRRY